MDESNICANRQEVKETFVSQSENLLALLIVLKEKGIVTDEEYRVAHLRAVSMLEQHCKGVHDAVMEQLRDESPLEYLYFKQMEEQS